MGIKIPSPLFTVLCREGIIITLSLVYSSVSGINNSLSFVYCSVSRGYNQYPLSCLQFCVGYNQFPLICLPFSVRYKNTLSLVYSSVSGLTNPSPLFTFLCWVYNSMFKMSEKICHLCLYVYEYNRIIFADLLYIFKSRGCSWKPPPPNKNE